ncbi:YdcF family protein [Streptomyces sp. NBC_01104]|uniref:YdcF family protein n=1 Tax=Streptomyces sp. NBC_01104 TaxID=2903750 RepID=UPI003863AC72|nr:YdcF family protein [Streptomyces sp. NBC_01104]
MLAYVPAFLIFVVFCVGTLRERRRFSNAVLLGLSLTFAATAWLAGLARSQPATGREIGIVLLVLVALGVAILSWFLISNGVTMVRKEGRSPANLLSLLTGLALVGLLALMITALILKNDTLVVVTGTVLALAGYIAFLLVCFVVYAFLYGRLHFHRRADYVVVLGAGLINGTTVSPLLAGRLDRARTVHTKLTARGRQPVLLASGGQGPDEKLPESHAMAEYLIERGFPAALIEREDRSTTTEENLRYSKSIMEKANPDYRCLVVTNNYHVFRAAVTARRTGVRGHVVGSPTAAYFWPSAMIREFVAIFLTYWRTNLAICLLLVLGGACIWLLS